MGSMNLRLFPCSQREGSMTQPSSFLQNRVRSYMASILLGSTIIACGISMASCGSMPKLLVSPSGIVIAIQPTNQASSIGLSASFMVMATGPGSLTYQWSVNGTTIPGATSANYSTPILVAADDGSTFTVTVSDSVVSRQQFRDTHGWTARTAGRRSPVSTGRCCFHRVWPQREW